MSWNLCGGGHPCSRATRFPISSALAFWGFDNGSNQARGAASPQQILESALARFPAFGLEVVKRTRWWGSKAWPEGAGPDFLNGVVLVRTAVGPGEVLEALHAIEREFGGTA